MKITNLNIYYNKMLDRLQIIFRAERKKAFRFYFPKPRKEHFTMAVFRVDKNKNYTVMSNHHLRNAALTLKAKGLLSQILSLPPEWDYTLKGLSRINRESIDAIRTAIQELERAGYITRSRERKENGQLGGAEYIINEQPADDFTPPTDNGGGNDNRDTSTKIAPTPPISTVPTLDAPMLENPTQDNSTLENPTQLNKERKAIKEPQITNALNTDSIPFTSPRGREETPKADRKGTEAAAQRASTFDIYRKIIHDNIEYDHLRDNHKYDHDRIDEIVDLMLETVCTSRKSIRIASDDYPAELVKSKFLKLNPCHIEYVLDCLKKNTTEVRNIKKYLLAVLFNAPSTIDSYYTSLVAHDMASGKLYGKKGGGA